MYVASALGQLAKMEIADESSRKLLWDLFSKDNDEDVKGVAAAAGVYVMLALGALEDYYRRRMEEERYGKGNKK